MELTDEQIKEAIAEGTISAITLDTAIFDGNGNRFEHGLLARLKQFNGTTVQVVLSDVVVGEVISHVSRDAADAHSKIKAGLKEVSKTWQVSQAQRDSAMVALFGSETSDQLARRRLDAFLKTASVRTIQAAGRVDIDTLLSAYFGSKPPFGKSTTKKNEFPDALALQALEHWAIEEGLTLLVVSKDGDWQRYCKTSPCLVVADDLANALSFFHQNAEVACSRLVDRFNAGTLQLQDAITDAIREASDRLTFTAQVSSGYFYDADVYDVDVTSIAIGIDEGARPLRVVDKPEEDVLVVEADVEATIAVTTEFQFSVTDPIDGDEVPIGSASATVEVLIDLKVLLTFQGDLGADADLVEVEVEMAARDIEVDYGDVGPDWDPDPDPT